LIISVDRLANDTVQLLGLHNAGRFDECRKGCLALLAEPDLTLFTRIQIHQMAASMSHPVLLKAHLDKAASLLEQMDADVWQVRLLKKDNDKQLAGFEWWIRANGMVGLPLEILRRRELIGPHGAGCMCDEVEKTDDAGTAATKEGK
jgi:hypothetical protein